MFRASQQLWWRQYFAVLPVRHSLRFSYVFSLVCLAITWLIVNNHGYMQRIKSMIVESNGIIWYEHSRLNTSLTSNIYRTQNNYLINSRKIYSTKLTILLSQYLQNEKNFNFSAIKKKIQIKMKDLTVTANNLIETNLILDQKQTYTNGNSHDR